MGTTILAVFAKAPVPGRVKTRLIPPLTAPIAAALHEAFVRDAVRLCQQMPDAALQLWTDISTDAWPELNVTRKLQISGDLGLKMLHTASAGLASGARRVLIVGADCPTLPLTHLQAATSAEADISLIPAEDGGYCAIGFRRTAPAMFQGVSWSSPAALAGTVRACEAAGLSVSIGPMWYDVDTPADLARLEHDPCLGEFVRAWFAANGSAPEKGISPAIR